MGTEDDMARRGVVSEPRRQTKSWAVSATVPSLIGVRICGHDEEKQFRVDVSLT